jgi:hypothetical protein
MIDHHINHVYRVKVVNHCLRLDLKQDNNVESPRVAEAPNWSRRTLHQHNSPLWAMFPVAQIR